MSPNMKAFQDTIAHSEIGPQLLALSDNGYNVIVGSTPQHPILFTDYSMHPRASQWVDLNKDGVEQAGEHSDAAGRYQFMGRYWGAYKLQLNLPDFSPDSQDRWCIQLIRECHAQDDVEAGNIQQALFKCRSRWASLPGAGYGQHENKMETLLAAFSASRGALA